MSVLPCTPSSFPDQTAWIAVAVVLLILHVFVLGPTARFQAPRRAAPPTAWLILLEAKIQVAYSYRSASTGFVRVAFIDSKLTVTGAITGVRRRRALRCHKPGPVPRFPPRGRSGIY